MNIVKKIKKNKLLIGVFFIYLFLFITMPNKGAQAVKSSMYYVIEMLEIMPVIFILTSLIEAWIPRKVIMDSFGEESGIKGSIFSFILGSFSAGPIYAAFPVCKTLLNKGASITNIVIILSTWAVLKVPMLANEAKFLGIKFMGVRWMLTTISIFVMAYMVALVVKNKDISNNKDVGSIKEGNIVEIKSQYCIGCGVCARVSPENFVMVDKKAKVKKEKVELSSMETINKAIERCPAKAIYFR